MPLSDMETMNAWWRITTFLSSLHFEGLRLLIGVEVTAFASKLGSLSLSVPNVLALMNIMYLAHATPYEMIYTRTPSMPPRPVLMILSLH